MQRRQNGGNEDGILIRQTAWDGLSDDMSHPHVRYQPAVKRLEMNNLDQSTFTNLREQGIVRSGLSVSRETTRSPKDSRDTRDEVELSRALQAYSKKRSGRYNNAVKIHPRRTSELKVFCGKLLPNQAIYKESPKDSTPKRKRNKKSPTTPSQQKAAWALKRSRPTHASSLEESRSKILAFIESKESRGMFTDFEKDSRQYPDGIPQDIAIRYARLMWNEVRGSDSSIKARYSRTPNKAIFREVFNEFEDQAKFGHMPREHLKEYILQSQLEILTGSFEDSDVDDCNIGPLERKLNVANLKNSAQILGNPGSFCVAPLTRGDFITDPKYESSEVPYPDRSPTDFLPSPGGLLQSRAMSRKWKHMVVKPCNSKANDPSGPSQSLELEWVYGYRSRDVHSNIVIDGDNKLIYPTSCIVVIFDIEAKTQSHYTEHTGGVTCLAQHPEDLSIIGSGESASIVNGKASWPCIRIWDSRTLETLAVLDDAHYRAVRCIDFSCDGMRLATVGFDEHDQIVVKTWNWEEKELIGSLKIGSELVFHLAWSPNDPSCFTTGGRNEMLTWHLDEGKLRFRSIPLTDPKERGRKTILCLLHTKNDDGCSEIVAGFQGTGELVLYRDNKPVLGFKAHEGSVFCLEECEGMLLSGGKDKKVLVLNRRLEVLKTFYFHSPIRSLYAIKGGKLVIGTLRSRIWELANWETVANALEAKMVVSGHFDGELHAIDVHPNNPNIFLTSAEDNRITIWDASKRQAMASWPITTRRGKRVKRRASGATSSQPSWRSSRAIAYGPEAKVIAVGTNCSELRIFDGSRHKEIKYLDLRKFVKEPSRRHTSAITCLRYSPNGQVLAMGLGRHMILVDVTQDYIPKCHIPLAGGVQNLDWTVNSEHLRVVTGACEIKHFDVFKSDLKLSRQTQDTQVISRQEFQTHTCVFEWGLLGLRNPDFDGAEVTAVCVDIDKGLLVAGDCYGNVTLARYPMLKTTNERIVIKRHANECSNIRINCTSTRVFSLGGRDKSVLQWKLEPLKTRKGRKRTSLRPELKGPSATAQPTKEDVMVQYSIEGQLRDKVNKLQKQLNLMKRRIVPQQKMLQENRKLRQQIALSNKEMQTQARIFEQKSRQSQMRNSAENDKLRKKISRLADQATSEATAIENAKLREKVEELKSDKREMLKRWAAAKELEEKEGDRKLQAELAAKVRLIETQKAKLASLEKKLKEGKKAQEKLEKEKAESESKLAESESKLEKEKAESESKLKKEKIELERQLTAEKGRVEIVRNEMEEEKAKLVLEKDQFEAQNRALQAEKLTLLANKKNIQRELLKLKKENKEKEEENEEREKELLEKAKGLREINEDLSKEKIRIERDAAKLKVEIRKWKKKYDAVCETRDTKLAEIKSFKEKADLSKEKANESEHRLKAIQDEKKALEMTIAGYKNDFKKRDEIIYSLKDQITSMREGKNALSHGEELSAKEEVAKLKAENEDLERTLQMFKHGKGEGNGSPAEVEFLRKTVCELEDKLKETEAMLFEDAADADGIEALESELSEIKEEKETMAAQLNEIEVEKKELLETKTQLADQLSHEHKLRETVQHEAEKLRKIHEKDETEKKTLKKQIKDKVRRMSVLEDELNQAQINFRETKRRFSRTARKLSLFENQTSFKDLGIIEDDEEPDAEPLEPQASSPNNGNPLEKNPISSASVKSKGSTLSDGESAKGGKVGRMPMASIVEDTDTLDDLNKDKNIKTCDMCELEPAAFICDDCNSNFCPECNDDMHTGASANHKRRPLNPPKKRKGERRRGSVVPEEAIKTEDLKTVESNSKPKPKPAAKKSQDPEPKPNLAPEGIMCGMCEVEKATLSCAECSDAFCEECDLDMHTGSSKNHKRVKIGEEPAVGSPGPEDNPVPEPNSPSTEKPAAETSESEEKTALKLKGSSKPGMQAKTPTCGMCEVEKAVVSCVECSDAFCEECDLDMHTGSSKNHKRVKIFEEAPSKKPAAEMQKPEESSKSKSNFPSIPATKQATKAEAPICGMCEVEKAIFSCHDCSDVFCEECDLDMHTGSSKNHKRTKIGEEPSAKPKEALKPEAKPELSSPRKPAAKVKAAICGMCEVEKATVSCAQCSDAFCDECDLDMHTGSSRNHKRIKIGEEPISDAVSAPEEKTAPKPSFSRKSEAKANAPMCGMCEVEKALFSCVECSDTFCEECDLDMHTGSSKNHKRTKIDGGVSLKKPKVETQKVEEKTTPKANASGNPKAKAPLCGMCEVEIAVLSCAECSDNFCAECDLDMHTGSSKNHKRIKLGVQPQVAKPTETKTPEKKSPLKPSSPVVSKSAAAPKKICGMCEVETAIFSCKECSDMFCEECDIDMHTGSAKYHKRTKIGGGGAAAVQTTAEDKSAKPKLTVTPGVPSKHAAAPKRICGMCEVERAILSCVECSDVFCEECDADMHMGSAKYHKRTKIGTAGATSPPKTEEKPAAKHNAPAKAVAKQICGMCEVELAVLSCEKCSDVFCEECDQDMHTGSAKYHKRVKIGGGGEGGAMGSASPAKKKPPTCGMCEVEPASKHCPKCDDYFCEECDSDMHTGSAKYHKRTSI